MDKIYLQDLPCIIFGCLDDEHYSYCVRCGRGYYDGQYSGLIWKPFHNIRKWLDLLEKLYPLHRCAECKKLIFRIDPSESVFLCSKECQDNWIPF